MEIAGLIFPHLRTVILTSPAQSSAISLRPGGNAGITPDRREVVSDPIMANGRARERLPLMTSIS